MKNWILLIPKDKKKRGELAEFAGLNLDEKLAIDKWCDLQALEDKRKKRRGLEADGQG